MILRVGLLLAVLALGCAGRARPALPGRAPFRFPADTFAFANETIWEYDVEPATGLVSWRRREPRPVFSLRCGTVVRAARQFYAGARFDAASPQVDADTYAALVKRVLHEDPRRAPEAR